MSYIVEGVIDTVFDTETVGNNNFQKRIVWVTTEEQYSQTLEIQFTQNNVDMLDGYKAGEKIKISVNVNGRKNEKNDVVRVFNSLIGYQISRR